MTTNTLVTKYQKLGSTFASADAAYANKNSMFSAEYLAANEAWLSNKREAGILVGPDQLDWDSIASTLTITRNITTSTIIEFNDGRPSADYAISSAEEAGWTFISQDLIVN